MPDEQITNESSTVPREYSPNELSNGLGLEHVTGACGPEDLAPPYVEKKSYLYKGPLPHPSIIREYEEIGQLEPQEEPPPEE